MTLSKDRNNPKVKPLHMAGSWNSKNRRMTTLIARDSWFKGSQEVEPPGSQKDGKPEDSSRRMEVKSQEERPPEVLKEGNAVESSRGMDNISGQDDTTDTTEERASGRMEESARGLEQESDQGGQERKEERAQKANSDTGRREEDGKNSHQTFKIKLVCIPRLYL